MLNQKKRQASPSFIIVLSFLGAIFLATIVFLLPIATTTGHAFSFLDALFMGVSSITITGLSPVSNLGATLTIFGKIMLGLFMQIGGLGVVSISVFLMIILRARIGISNRVLLRENLNISSLGGVVQMLKKIVIFTFGFELVGFLLNLFVFLPSFAPLEAIGYSLFYALSFFNNAGFNIMSTADYLLVSGHPLFVLNSLALVMFGGIGIIVLIELFSFKKRPLSMHTKIVLLMNTILWVFGVLLLKLGQNAVNSFTWGEAIQVSLTARSAGLYVNNPGDLSSLSLLVLMVLMFIGGAPTGTASGVKVTTIFTLGHTLVTNTLGQRKPLFKRRINEQSKQKAIIIVFLVFFVFLFGTFCLLLLDNLNLEIGSFTAMAALSNAGYDFFDISTLSSGSKIVLIFLMFTGRVGALTIISSFNKNVYKTGKEPLQYLEEKIIIG